MAGVMIKKKYTECNFPHAQLVAMKTRIVISGSTCAVNMIM